MRRATVRRLMMRMRTFSSSSSSSSSTKSDAAVKNTERMLVAPSGSRLPTQKFLFKGPDGSSVSFEIPSHVRPGESFTVDVPLASLHSKDVEIKREIREKIEALERSGPRSTMMDNESIKRQIQSKIEVLKKKTDVVSSKNSDKLLNSLRSEIETKSKNLQEMKRMIEVQSRNLNELIEKVDHITSKEDEHDTKAYSKSQKRKDKSKNNSKQIKNLTRKEFLRFMNNTPISKMTPQELKSADRMLVGFANMLNREEVRTVLRRLSYDGQFDRALSFLKHIKNSKVKENPETFGLLITANIRGKSYSQKTILRLLKVMRDKNVSPDTITVNKILTQCWKRGTPKGVDDVVKMLPWFNVTLDLDSYTSIIGCYAKHFYTERVETMISVMDQNNLEPDEKIFALTIQSCGKNVDRARAYIQEMQERHGLYPNKFHYTELAMVYIRADRANEIESVVIPEMQASGIELDEIFIQQYVVVFSFVSLTQPIILTLVKHRYGLHYCRNADWRKTIKVFRRLYSDPNRRVGQKVIMIMNQLRKWDQWKALVEFFELLDNGELRKEKKGGIPGNIVRARHLQAAIDAYGQLGEWEKVLKTYERLEEISKNIKPESRDAVIRQSASAVEAARRALGRSV